jgi:WD40 repeat protein
MKRLLGSLMLVGLSIGAHPVRAAEIKGKVAEVKELTVKIVSDSDLVPKVGDKVEIVFVIPGIDDVAHVAEAKVTEIGDDFILAKIESRKGKVAKNQTAKIFSDSPQKRQKAAAPKLEIVGEIRHFGGGDGAGIFSIAVSPDGGWVLSTHGDKTVRLWDVEAGKEARRFQGHTGVPFGVAFSPDGRRAISAGDDKVVRLWDVETGQELRHFEGHSHRIRSVAFSPDGRRALSGSDDRTMRLWDVETGQELRRFDGHRAEIMSVSFSADGSEALSGSLDPSMSMARWDIAAGKDPKQIIVVGGEGSSSAVFSPDNTCIVSCGYGTKNVRLWDARTGAELRRFEGHTDLVSRAVFSPDGRRVLSSSADATVRLWDVQTGKELNSFHSHTDNVTCVAFSPDGRRALSGSLGDSTVRLWGLPK